MKYISTRGGAAVAASEAILRGIAEDGGLYVPEEFPCLSQAEIAALGGLPYPERAVRILSLLLTDYSEDELRQAAQAAYSRFDDPAVAPVRLLPDGDFLLELFHGPTLAFKDLALQLLPHLVSLAARKNGERREICILTATSGDTGKAALEGFRDVPGTSCTVFYPLDGVSDIQQRQMTTTDGANTHVIAVRGNFDDAQTGVKRLFSSPEFNAVMHAGGKVLSSANSINIGRLAPQIVYYFSAYADLVHAGRIPMGEPLSFAVPTGNFGDILSAYYAGRMGLPVGQLICASNANDVLTEFFRTGVYQARRPFRQTMSPSMDILVSSNLERLLFEAADRDCGLVRQWMAELAAEGRYTVPAPQLDWLRARFAAYSADDQTTGNEISRRWQSGTLLDPHTAVAASALRSWRGEQDTRKPALIVSTASPYKFSADVLDCIAPEARQGDAFACADSLEKLSGIPVPENIRRLKNLPIRHTAACGRDEMGQAVRSALGLSD